MIDVADPELVTRNGRLNELCEAWQSLSYLAIDTEFIRVSTFYPRAGLIQVCDGTATYLLDPLELTEWDSFVSLLQAPGIVKVMHSCSEDLVVFQHFYRCVPGPIFDTQKAAAFLGHGYSISYLNLVQHIVGVALSKGETRSDWLQRPLSANQVKYAALDVAYLPRLYEELSEALADSGKLSYLQAECERMRTIAQAVEAPDNWSGLYLTMGAAWRLNAAQLGVLQNLSLWRERTARQRDKPKSWIARDADLIQLAEKMPADQAALQTLKDMTRNIYRQDADTLLEIIADSEPVSADIANNLEGAPMSPAQRARLKHCQQAVKSVAGSVGMAEELLARKKQLISLMHLNQDRGKDATALIWPDDLGGWQQTLLSPRLTPILLAGEEGAVAEEKDGPA